MVVATCVAVTGILCAHGNDPLLRLLVRKGLITEAEAAEVQAELAAANPEAATTDAIAVAPEAPLPPAPPPPPVEPTEVMRTSFVSTANGNFLRDLRINGRMQVQYANLSTDIDGTTADPVRTNHTFMRRVYFGVRGRLADGWTSNIVYDFAGSNFDAAYIQWQATEPVALVAGLTKAPLGLEEEFTSSGSLKAIERSPATRYFVEPNNGRRLGAGSYRTGLFLHGEQNGLEYRLAVTNPERISGTGTSAGDGTNNTPAWWGHVSYSGEANDNTYRIGASLGVLPDQGGTAPGAGEDLAVASIFGEFSTGDMTLAGEYLFGRNDNGAGPGLDADPTGFWIQPSYRFGNFEAVLRYSHVDSDGRGISLSDGVRSAPSGGTMDTMSEWFLGGNWYILGNDAKLQAGFISADSDNTVSEGTAGASTQGFRSQVQVQF